jgi:hypothetical protein
MGLFEDATLSPAVSFQAKSKKSGNHRWLAPTCRHLAKSEPPGSATVGVSGGPPKHGLALVREVAPRSGPDAPSDLNASVLNSGHRSHGIAEPHLSLMPWHNALIINDLGHAGHGYVSLGLWIWSG